MTFAQAALSSQPAFAQDWAKASLEKSPRHLEWVKVKRGKREVSSFLAYPEVKNKATAVVVIHEIFGLSDWVRSVADQLAADGFIAIAPDLLSQKGPAGGGTGDFKSQDDVRKAIADLDKVEGIKDLQSVSAYVSKLPACNGKVAIVGFCWGGGKAWRYAAADKKLKAAHVFYGVGPDSDGEVTKIPCPILGYYGENDNRVNSTIDRTVEWMKKAGKFYEPITYTGAGHGFMRAGEAPDGKAADKEARAQAWKRMTDQLRGL
jgi:Dienelactone hydrolase and related enzymes